MRPLDKVMYQVTPVFALATSEEIGAPVWQPGDFVQIEAVLPDGRIALVDRHDRPLAIIVTPEGLNLLKEIF